MAIIEIGKLVNIRNITLDYENPRHERLNTLKEIIEHLCKNEAVLELARDIAEHGTNPLESIGVMPGDKEGTYISKEGNRRLCAIKLLSDPDLAPSNLRKTFENLSKNWTPVITELRVVIFETQKEINIWLDRIHNGANNGKGRRPWTAEQQARRGGRKRYNLALDLLDYAEQESFITTEQRGSRITTIDRFLSNPLMRDVLGIDKSDPNNTSRNRPENDFKKLVKKFITDLLYEKDGEIASRKNKIHIEAYARELSQIEGISSEKIKPVSIAVTTEGEAGKIKKSKPKPPPSPETLIENATIKGALVELGNFKLQKLYYSICSVSLVDHTQLICIGYWSFIECLAATMGSKSETSMIGFFSKPRLVSYGFEKGVKQNALMEAIKRTSQHGNTTKHDPISGHFNPDQLANDYETMQPLIIKCLEEAIIKKS